MIHSVPARVKASARAEYQQLGQKYQQPRQISFVFRADPTALDDVKLPRTARAVFALVLDNARRRAGSCRLSNGVMARILGCCPMTIGRALAALEAAGLVRRELSHGGRVRSGILVTWDGVQQPCLTERPCVQHERPRGSTSVLKGVQHSCGTNQSPIQNETSDADRPSLEGGEDPEAAALFASLGPAKYLQAMIAKGREEAAARSAGKPAPSPAPAKAIQASQDGPTDPPAPISDPAADRPATAKPAASPTTIRREEPRPAPRTVVKSASAAPAAPRTYAPTPYVPVDQVAATIARMTRGLAEGLKAEDVGRRRVGPKRLAAQLAEVRRKHGRRE
jgi:hypothetical protein